jgi:hypothetical protein
MAALLAGTSLLKPRTLARKTIEWLAFAILFLFFVLVFVSL